MKHYLSFWIVALLAVCLGGAAACSYLQGVKPLADATVDVANEACKFAPALTQSPALQLEADRLGLPIATLVGLVCQSAELYDEYIRAREMRMADPGVAVVVRLRSSR